ncbi:hypothetical protein [Aquamicrobium soli]|uniref:Uncharacterized protein n=1 Tax=Aquamicrobium soli TaxID=1811518 RepID=A0ABV7KFL7_9HYPH
MTERKEAVRAPELTADMKLELERLVRDPKYGNSDRARDRARTKLKRLGLIRFDRKVWQWVVLPVARQEVDGE